MKYDVRHYYPDPDMTGNLAAGEDIEAWCGVMVPAAAALLAVVVPPPAQCSLCKEIVMENPPSPHTGSET